MIYKHISKITFLNKPVLICFWFLFWLFALFFVGVFFGGGCTQLNGFTQLQTIQFSINPVFCLHTVNPWFKYSFFVYTQLNDQTVLLQTI